MENPSDLFEFKKVAVIMAGGGGNRLWPRSTEKVPKQFTHYIGDGTMIQNTVSRLLPSFSFDEIYIVAPESSADIINEQIPAIPGENIILEPFGKNTAPCLALTLTQIRTRLTDDTIIYALPSDHVIFNVREFQNSLSIAGDLALTRKCIATIGINPVRPETSYGYIQVDDNPDDLDELYTAGVRKTKTFAEKPDVETAGRFIDSGDFLWNSGIFVWRADTFWTSFEKYMPEQFSLFGVLGRLVGKELYHDAVKDLYRQIESVSLDYAILEKAKNVYVVESSFGWSDLGSWDELYRLSMKDARNNVLEGDVVAIETANCLISAHGKLIGTVGVDNLIIIDSEDAFFVCKRGNSAQVKELVGYLRRKHIGKI